MFLCLVLLYPQQPKRTVQRKQQERGVVMVAAMIQSITNSPHSVSMAHFCVSSLFTLSSLFLVLMHKNVCEPLVVPSYSPLQPAYFQIIHIGNMNTGGRTDGRMKEKQRRHADRIKPNPARPKKRTKKETKKKSTTTLSGRRRRKQ